MSKFDSIQWLFDTDVFSTALNWPVNARGVANAKVRLDALVDGNASANLVLEAYKAFAGAIGPSCMSSLLQSDDAFPEVNHSGKPTPPSPGKITLYVDPAGKRVLAEVFNEWGKPPVLALG